MSFAKLDSTKPPDTRKGNIIVIRIKFNKCFYQIDFMVNIHYKKIHFLLSNSIYS